MADYDFIAIDTRGNERRGHIAAETIDAARYALDARKYYVVKIDPGSPPVVRGRPLFGLQLGKPKMNTKHLTLFTRQLATLNCLASIPARSCTSRSGAINAGTPGSRGGWACSRRSASTRPCVA